MANDPHQQSLPHMKSGSKQLVRSVDNTLEIALSIGVYMASLPGAVDDGTGTGKTTAGDGKTAYRQSLYAYNNKGCVRVRVRV